MATLNRNNTNDKSTFKTEDRLRRNEYDIIECVKANSFAGVDAALEVDENQINLQREGIGVTALMVAAGYGLERMVEHLLIKPGIDIHLKDDYGMTALEHGRMHPNIVHKIVSFEHPNLKWKEPPIAPV